MIRFRQGRPAGRKKDQRNKHDVGNQHASTTIVAALSTTIRLYPMNVLLDPPEGGLTKPSIVKTSQILTVSKERLEKKLGAITPEKMQEVNQALRLSLAL
jgi:mRNA interferase MazF